MKWLFYLLVLANLAYFGWAYQQEWAEERQRSLASAAERRIPQLLLLGEVEDPMVYTGPGEDVNEAAADSPLRADGAQPQPPERQRDASAVVVTERPEKDVLQVPVLESGPPQGDGSSPRTAGPETALAAEETAPLSPPPTSARVTSSETPGAEVDVSTVTAGQEPSALPADVEAAEPLEKSPAVRRCFALGPLEDEKLASRLSEELKGTGLYATVRQQTEERQIGYWVIVPAQKDRQTAIAKIDELRDAGFRDVWLFRQGTLSNAISVGLFSKQGNAELRRKQVLERGFQADVQPRYVSVTRYWLDFESAKQPALKPSILEELGEQMKSIETRERSCAPLPAKE